VSQPGRRTPPPVGGLAVVRVANASLPLSARMILAARSCSCKEARSSAYGVNVLCRFFTSLVTTADRYSAFQLNTNKWFAVASATSNTK
jgi:hypothetical protein